MYKLSLNELHWDAQWYGKPYVWDLTLGDFELDPRDYTDDMGAICPIEPEWITCGHPWSHCKKCDMRSRTNNSNCL